VAHATVDAFATFKERSFTPKNDHVTQTTPFRGIFYLAMRLAGQVSSQGKSLAVVDLLAKFKEYSICILVLLANCHLFHFISLHLTVRVLGVTNSTLLI